jgi:hypothetical protein
MKHQSIRRAAFAVLCFTVLAVLALAARDKYTLKMPGVAFTAPTSGQADGGGAPIFGIKSPPGYRDWRLVSVAHEEGNLNDIRAILSNDVAIEAYRDKKLPFPDGTIIAWLAATGGWGGARSSKTANLPTRRCSKPASLVTSRAKPGTLFSPITHRDTGESKPRT